MDLDLKRLQTITSDDAFKAEIVKQIIYKKADFISTGVKLVGVRQFNTLDVKYSFASESTVEYPVPEGAKASLASIVWTEFGLTLQKAEGRFRITDEAGLRGTNRQQYETGVRRLSEALAKEKDEEILDTLAAGAGNSFDATATWNSATVAQITGDVAKAIDYILSAKGVADSDIVNIAFVVPLKAWTSLMKIVTIENANFRLLDYVQDSYKIQILPTKHFTNYGIALLKGADTAIHGVLAPGAGIPLVETERIAGVGVEYIVRQYFKTKVVPESSTQSTSNRIVKITSIL
ncbi:MAG: phage major capsid protein [Candidatus Thorarchaeota archaeon]